MARKDRLIYYYSRRISLIFSCIAALFIACLLYSCISSCHVQKEAPAPKASATDVVDDNTHEVTLPNKSEFEDPNSILVLVNKANPISSEYEPDDLIDCKNLGITTVGSNRKLRQVAAQALKEMCDAAKQDGVDIFLGSGYRSYKNHDILWHSYADKDGAEVADGYSARAGYSEHQTGLCFDAAQGDGGFDGYNYTKKFETTKMGKWLLENSWKYGYILRYPLDKEGITGYVYEPWHYRYVGKKWAKYIHDLGDDITFEEVFNLSGGLEFK